MRHYAKVLTQQQTFAPASMALALLLGLSVLLAGLHRAPAAWAEGVPVQCPPTTSLDHRLLLEQWALGGDCQRPVRSRVTDRYLGYTCLDQTDHAATCRSYVPSLTSRALDTSKHFRCVEVAVTASEGGVVINLVREWVAPAPRKCDWNSSPDQLAMEVDFDSAQVCTAGMCLAIDRLSVIGKVRLRHLVEKAFRELDLMGETSVRYVIGPVPVRGR